MSTTLLTGVNAVLKRVGFIKGDSGALTSFTDSGRQVGIDLALQCWNEVADEIASLTNTPKPTSASSDTITLAASTRAYSLNSGATILVWPLIDTTNDMYIYEYPGGYFDLIADQGDPSKYTSLPNYAAIRPSDGKLYIDTSPASTYAGRVYTYQFETLSAYTTTTDTFTFSDEVYRALVPAVAQLWDREQKRQFDAQLYRSTLARAAKLIGKTMPTNSWMPRRPIVNITDPLNG